MIRFLHSVLVLCAAAMIASCGMFKNKGPELVKGTENAAGGPTYLIGLVEMVNPEQKFVLIRTETRTTIPAGHALTAIDATGARTTLKVSPENKQNFLTADITEGMPRVGNLVIYRPGLQGQSAGKPGGQPALPGVEIPPGTVPPSGLPSSHAGALTIPAGGNASGSPTSSPIPFQPLPEAPSVGSPVGSAPPPPAPAGERLAPAGGIVLPPVVR